MVVMAARKSTFENRVARRMAMVAMRRRGVSFTVIGMKFSINRNSARQIVLKACNGMDPKKEGKSDVA